MTNTGNRAGADVAQIYVGEASSKVSRPSKELQGFARFELAPAETKHITVPLDARAFTYYDVSAKHWHADAGTYFIEVGRSYEDIEQHSEATLLRSLDVGNDE